MENEINCTYAAQEKNRYEKLRSWFWNLIFPFNFDKWPHHIPESEALQHGITTDVRIHFGWKDRLRILIGGTVRVETMTLMDVQPNKTHSLSATSIRHGNYQ